MPSSRWTGECETNIEQEHSPLLAKADHCPQVVRWTRASGTTRRERRSPPSRNCADKSFVFEGAVSCVFWRWPAGQLWILLGKGGVAAPLKKMSRSHHTGADGVVRSREIVLEFERTTPSAPFKGTGIFLDGASTPPLPRRGIRFKPTSATIKCVYFTGLYARVQVPPE